MLGLFDGIFHYLNYNLVQSYNSKSVLYRTIALKCLDQLCRLSSRGLSRPLALNHWNDEIDANLYANGTKYPSAYDKISK